METLRSLLADDFDIVHVREFFRDLKLVPDVDCYQEIVELFNLSEKKGHYEEVRILVFKALDCAMKEAHAVTFYYNSSIWVPWLTKFTNWYLDDSVRIYALKSRIVFKIHAVIKGWFDDSLRFNSIVDIVDGRSDCKAIVDFLNLWERLTQDITLKTNGQIGFQFLRKTLGACAESRTIPLPSSTTRIDNIATRHDLSPILNLPPELFQEIFQLEIPIMTLLSLRRVCHDFRTTMMAVAHRGSAMLIYEYPTCGVIDLDYSKGRDDVVCRVPAPIATEVELLGCANGLVALLAPDAINSELSKVVIWNPMTSRCRTVACLKKEVSFGFGYDICSRDFFVVTVNPTNIMILRLGSYWKKVWHRPSDIDLRGILFAGGRNGFYLSGVLYWTHRDAIFFFHPQDESFKKIVAPFKVDESNISDFEGSLSFTMPSDGGIEFWVLMSELHWHRKFVIRDVNFCPDTKILKLTKRKQVLFYNKLELYVWDGHNVERVRIGRNIKYKALSFSPTFMALPETAAGELSPPLENLLRIVYKLDMDSPECWYEIYKRLPCALDPLTPDNSEYQFVKKYLHSTSEAGNSACNLELEAVFAVTMEAEPNALDWRTLKNKMLLWHDSRRMNFVDILNQGLRVVSPEATASFMLDKGIHFVDIVGQDAQYCFTDQNYVVGFMLLCEVALGEDMDDGMHFTKVLGKWKPCNHYIVHDPAHVRMRYLLKVRLVTRGEEGT